MVLFKFVFRVYGNKNSGWQSRATIGSVRPPSSYWPGTEHFGLQHDEGEAIRRAFPIVAAFPRTMK